MRVLGQDSRLSTALVDRFFLAAAEAGASSFRCSARPGSILDEPICVCSKRACTLAHARYVRACVCMHTPAVRSGTLPAHTRSLFVSRFFFLLSYTTMFSPFSPLPSCSSRVFPLTTRSVPVAQSSVHSRSRDEANRLPQTFFSPGARRPSLMKSYVAGGEIEISLRRSARQLSTLIETERSKPIYSLFPVYNLRLYISIKYFPNKMRTLLRGASQF